ncbi:MAG: hypothetical protein B7Z55_14050 [Planctomycetales bacterium 12-60-4]|nr:MAG: hypothetical protein B7Z55_14050 [Planctomycetales bacterium 12-60-4]
MCHQFPRVLLIVAGLTTLVGCGQSDGPQRLKVHGAVLFDRQPMKAGVIRFIPARETKGPAGFGTIADGFYEIPAHDGLVVGRYRVEIEGNLETSFPIDDEAAYAKAFVETKGKPIPKQAVPPGFNQKSTLTAEVTSDGLRNKFDFDLKLPE